MAEAVGHWGHTLQTPVHNQASPFDICAGQSGTGTHVSMIPTMLHTHLGWPLFLYFCIVGHSHNVHSMPAYGSYGNIQFNLFRIPQIQYKVTKNI
jgi:hypothetical protein